MRRQTKYFWAPILAAALCLPVARAQQQSPPANPVSSTGNQAGGQAGTSGQDSRQEPPSPALGPTPVVTGGFAPRVAEISTTTSQIRTGFNAGVGFDSNYAMLPVPKGWSTIINLGGHFDLHRLGPNSDMVLGYLGGGQLAIPNQGFNSSYHVVNFGETIQFQRWSLSVHDSFSYLPESAFGFVGGAPNGITLPNQTPLGPSVIPNQGILTTQAARLSNIVLAQAQILATERSTWTITGDYGILHYLTSGFLNSSNISFGAGYNYRLRPRDVIGISYQFNSFRYGATLPSVSDSQILITYGHQITGRLSVQAGAGPDFNKITTVGGPSTGTNFNVGLVAGLSYKLERTSLGGSFFRGTTGGGGVLLASVTNQFQFNASRGLGQYWSVNGNIGYSTNNSLPQALIVSTYNTLFAGGGIARQLGERSSIFVNYNLLRQTTNVVCGGPACAGPLLRNQIWIGFNFDFRPIGIN